MTMMVIGIAAYLVVGLFASRQVKFKLENGVDKNNARREREWDEWKGARRQSTDGYNWIPMEPDHGGVQKTYASDLSGFYVALPILGGLFWWVVAIFLVVRATLHFGWRVARVPLVPAVRWFFENPARRKERRHTAVKP